MSCSLGPQFTVRSLPPCLFFLVKTGLLLVAFAGLSSAEVMGPALQLSHPDQRVYVAPFEKALAGKITLEFRVKFDEIVSGEQNLAGDAEGENDFCSMIRFYGDPVGSDNSGELHASLRTESAIGSAITQAIATVTMEPGYWYHIASVADGENLTLFLNGKIVAQQPYEGDLVNTGNAFYIGKDGVASCPGITIDEVRIWDTARTALQLQYYMHRRVLPFHDAFTDLRAYWRFDEGTGNTAEDATDRGNDGIIQGAARWVEREGCQGDFQYDKDVDGSDLAFLASNMGWGNCPDEWMCPGDVNKDLRVDGLDVEAFAACFGRDDCQARHVYAIIDAMVAESPYSVPDSNDYTGLRFGQCTGPYVPDMIGEQIIAQDVNTDIGGTTTGIWAKYEYLPLDWAGPVLTDIEVTHWPGWNITCPEGWVTASGTSAGKPGALTTGTDGGCWRNGLCVQYSPLNESDTFVTNLCLSDYYGTIPLMCETDGVFWPMGIGGVDIHRECGGRFVYLGRNHAKAWPSMPQSAPEFDDEEKYTLLETYAPQVWFRGEDDERYWPSSVEWAWDLEPDGLERFLNTDGRYWLRTEDDLDSPSQGDLDVFSGDLSTAPVYAYFIKKKIPVDTIEVEVVDLVYFFYFPYNRGKSVINTVFESHVSDWEHITVRMAWQFGETAWEFKPSQVYVSAHDFGGTYDWEDHLVGKVLDTHPVVYSAWGSHGLWIDQGNHVYEEVCYLFNCEDLIDSCFAGVNWDTWGNVVAFDYYDPEAKNGRGLGGSVWPAWMGHDFTDPGCDVAADPGCDTDPAAGPIYRWGNPEWGSVWGYPRLADGPTGPVSKGVMTSIPLQ